MKRKMNFGKISTIGLCAAMAATLAFGAAFTFPPNQAEETDSAENYIEQTVEGGGTDRVTSGYATSNNGLIFDETAKLHTYAAGMTYWYIDYSAGVKFADPAGTSKPETDIVTIDVDTTKAKGDKLNPYVINSKDDWDNFVTYAKTTANQTKSYVLNCDLDYAGGTIKSVANFSGNFFGTGHKISNVSYSTANAVSNHALGLFCRVTGTAYFADLVLENVTINGGAIGHVGGLIGHSDANLTVTDVAVTGAFTATNPAAGNTSAFCNGSPYIGYGGISGCAHGSAKTVSFYKCATDVKITVSNSNKQYVGAGGLSGLTEGYLTGAMAAINVYDCYSAVDFNYTGYSASLQLWTGMLGFVRSVNYNTMKRCFSIFHIKAGTSSVNMSPGIMFTVGENKNNTSRYNLDHCYGYGNFSQGSTNKALPFVGRYMDPGNATTTNSSVYSDYKANGYYTNTSGGSASSGLASACTPAHNAAAASLDALKTKAKSAFNNPAVWASEVLDQLTTANRPNIIETPILVNRIRVAYYEYKNGSEIAYQNAYLSGETAGDFKEVKFSQLLYEPTGSQIPAGRVFKGWTTDTSGNGEVFTEVPKTLHGDNKIYAVWGIDKDSITVGVEVTAKNGSKVLEYGENGFECVYNESGITLTAATPTVSGNAMTDIESYGWQWVKGSDKISNGVAESYKVKNVSDSGEYGVTVKFRSVSEPLFCDTVTSALKKTKMTKAPLVLSNAKFEEGVHPYSGAPYDTAIPVAMVTDESGSVIIEGTTDWYIHAGNFNSDTSKTVVEDGKLKEVKEIWFELDEKYSGNYGDPDKEDGTVVNGMKFEIKFEIEYLHFIFEIDGYRVKPKVYVNLEYNQNYTYNNVAALFEDAFKEDIVNFPGLSPVFVDGTDRYTINEYRKKSGTAYKSVKEDHTLQVVFEAESYKVTYDPRNGTSDIFTEEIGYGIRLSRPLDPEYGDQLFLGWYYDVEGESEPRQWNFDSDRVTGETNLYARWLAADTLDALKVEVVSGAVFRANEPLDPSKLIVTATFSGRDGDTKLEQSTILSCGDKAGQYEIDYQNTDNLLHVVRDKNDVIQKTEVIIRYTFKRQGKEDQIKEERLLLDVERIKLDTELLRPYFKDTTVELKKGEAQTIKIPEGKVRDLFAPYLLDSGVTYEYSQLGQPLEAGQVMEVGDYLIKANFRTQFADYEAPSITATLHIVGEKIALKIEWDATEFSYNGKVQLPKPTFMNPKYNDEIVTVNYELTDTHTHAGDDADKCLNALKVGNYSIRLTITDSGYKFESGTDFVIVNFTIIKAKVKVPTQKEKLEYRGTKYDLNNLEPEDYEMYFDNLDPALMTVGEGAEGMNAGVYKAFITLSDPSCAEWDGVSSARVTMDWEIKKAQLSVYWGNDSAFEYNGEIQYPTVVRFIGLMGDDSTAVDLSADINYNVKDIKAEVGGYTVSMSFKPGAVWAKNYELDETKSFSFAIVPEGASGDIILVNVEWVITRFVFNDEFQQPVFKLVTKEGKEDVTDMLKDFILFDGTESARWAGKYDVTIAIDPDSEYGASYFLVGKPSCQYTIVKNSSGEGENPNGSDPDNKDEGDNPIAGTIELPLWQLIVGGVSAVLFLVCTAKSFGEYGKYKAAKREAKELASMTYSVTYGFAPLPLLAISFLGASETVWTAIACSALGLFLLSFAAMLLLGKKRKAAELVVRREKARIEEEKEYARQEEQMRRDEEQQRRDEAQQRRDEEFRMMFAAMQQNYQQPQMQYDDMRSLLAETVSALLPAMSQMQALPPAQSDANAYSVPQAGYGAPQQQYGETSPEAEALRAQMAQQQAQMAQQQAQMAAQQAQMAQQQELINQLLQQNQAQASAQEYDEAAAAADEAFWIDESEKIASLEELYGKLSDDAKRCYYEIGSYIMNKPRTAQNDGKYAVLFKYRGKTLFKLCIKEDAPVLYYSTDDGGKSEVRINGAETLEAARKVVDLRIMQTDSTM